MFRSAHLVGLALLVTACGAAPPDPVAVSPIPAYPGKTATNAPAAPTPVAAPSFATLRDRVVDRWLSVEPARGRQAGLHAYDGLIGDYSAAAIQARLTELDAQRAALAAADASKLSPDELLDQKILLGQIDLLLFNLRDVAAWQKQPAFYEDLFRVDGYINRDYAPLVERAQKLVQHEEASLAQVANIRKNLVSPMSKPVLETAVKIYKGYAEYLSGDVKKLMGGVGDAAFQSRFAKANDALAKQAQELADYLEKVEVPKGDQSHVLGRERYMRLLAAQEDLHLGLDEVKAMGEKNLADNKKAYEDLKKKGVRLSPTKASEMFQTATWLVEQSRRFIIEKKLVTIPSNDLALVKESPPYMRWNSAFLDPPGPFEDKATGAFYYITLPDPSWPKAEQEAYLMPKGVLLSTSVHEVYPGHYLQGQWERRAPTRVQKLFGAYSFVEGWAHYVEQMMIEEGFGKADKESHLGQLSDALLRNCRYVVSIGVHVEGMTLEQAAKRFETDCFQDKATAREQAVRATFDPGYFAYTLGKVQILALREEAKKRFGDKFSLMDFHDALLSHGSPPVPLIHDRVLAEMAEKIAKNGK